MIKGVKKWLQDQKNIVTKIAGLKEKEEATKRKLEVAMSILNPRLNDIPVPFERRKANA